MAKKHRNSGMNWPQRSHQSNTYFYNYMLREDIWDMGAVANPYRQIKYLAIRMERYSGYAMNDMRLHVIQFSATQETLVPEPDDNDGTSESIGFEFETTLSNNLSLAILEIVTYWTGLWPNLHVIVSKTFNSDVSFNIHGTIDLLGSASISDFSYTFYGAEEMTSQESDDLMDEAENAWLSDMGILIGFIVMSVLWTIPRLLAIDITHSSEGWFWLSLMAAVAGTLVYIGFLIYAVLNSAMAPWKAGITFLAIAIALLLLAISGKRGVDMTLKTHDPFWSSAGAAFEKIFCNEALDGLGGAVLRTHYAIYVVGFALAIVCFTIAIALFLSYLL
ncbi:MAG: hypothetical protein JW779_01290 [Candidatus Thorarchaeota archaeon]|nr:hypothetical protein [Candidatus Thorarchaeota archaeon]